MKMNSRTFQIRTISSFYSQMITFDNMTFHVQLHPFVFIVQVALKICSYMEWTFNWGSGRFFCDCELSDNYVLFFTFLRRFSLKIRLLLIISGIAVIVCETTEALKRHVKIFLYRIYDLYLVYTI